MEWLRDRFKKLLRGGNVKYAQSHLVTKNLTPYSHLTCFTIFRGVLLVPLEVLVIVFAKHSGILMFMKMISLTRPLLHD
jgi:hypothetical protein